MSPSASKLKPSFARFLCISSVVMTLTGCASSTRPLPDKPDPLVIQNCPPLVALTDDTFGATTLKLIEVAAQYHKCRAAALGRFIQVPE